MEGQTDRWSEGGRERGGTSIAVIHANRLAT